MFGFGDLEDYKDRWERAGEELTQEKNAHYETRKKLEATQSKLRRARDGIWSAMQILKDTGSVFQALKQLETAWNSTEGS